MPELPEVQAGRQDGFVTNTELVAKKLTRRLAVIGAADVAAGFALAHSGRAPVRQAFGQQTAAWGAIDLVIAGVGALSAARGSTPDARRLRRTLLVNSVLDVGYIAAGAVLVRRPGLLADRLNPEQARGYGAAVIVQGAVLLVLDVVHARAVNIVHARALRPVG
jgi:hypothetical protein